MAINHFRKGLNYLLSHESKEYTLALGEQTETAETGKLTQRELLSFLDSKLDIEADQKQIIANCLLLSVKEIEEIGKATTDEDTES